MMAEVFSAVRDETRGHRALWAGVAAVLSGVFIALGFSYLLGGIKVAASSQSYAVVQQFIPGGMRTHGALMLAIGGMLAYGLLAPLYGLPILHRWARRSLIAVIAYSFWLVFEFGCSWWLAGKLAVAPIIWWSAAAVLSALLVKLPPAGGHVKPCSGGSDGSGRA